MSCKSWFTWLPCSDTNYQIYELDWVNTHAHTDELHACVSMNCTYACGGIACMRMNCMHVCGWIVRMRVDELYACVWMNSTDACGWIVRMRPEELYACVRMNYMHAYVRGSMNCSHACVWIVHNVEASANVNRNFGNRIFLRGSTLELFPYINVRLRFLKPKLLLFNFATKSWCMFTSTVPAVPHI